MKQEINTATTHVVISQDKFSFYEFGGLYIAQGTFKNKKGKGQAEEVLRSGLGWNEVTKALISIKGITFDTRLAN